MFGYQMEKCKKIVVANSSGATTEVTTEKILCSKAK